MTCRVQLKGRTYYVYGVSDKGEGIALAEIAQQRMSHKPKGYATKIDAWKFMDNYNTYYIKARCNGDIEINTKNF